MRDFMLELGHIANWKCSLYSQCLIFWKSRTKQFQTTVLWIYWWMHYLGSILWLFFWKNEVILKSFWLSSWWIIRVIKVLQNFDGKTHTWFLIRNSMRFRILLTLREQVQTCHYTNMKRNGHFNRLSHGILSKKITLELKET